jgi:hypothetical protein
MPASIQFDGQEILSTTYTPRFIKHESSPNIQINDIELSHDNGSVLVSERTGNKIITLEGVLTGSSEADLESKIDAFKEVFRRVNKNLDISWNGGTRRYVATCQAHSFDRDHFNIGYVPWTAEFLVPSGIAEETTEISIVSDRDITTQDYIEKDINFLGSAPPKPRIRIAIQGSSSADAKGIEIKNDDTGERIICTLDSGIINPTVYTFDCRLKTVTSSGVQSLPISYYGVFPKFLPGEQNISVRIADITAESFEGPASPNTTLGVNIYSSTHEPCMAFVLPFGDTTFQGIEVNINKTGDPNGDLTITIEPDLDGEPKGVAFAIKSFTIAKADVAASLAWIKANSADAFSLSANTKYWMRCRTTNGDSSNCYMWQICRPPYTLYKKGGMATYNGSTYTQSPTYNAWFKLLFGGKWEAGKTYHLNVDYYKQWL